MQNQSKLLITFDTQLKTVIIIIIIIIIIRPTKLIRKTSRCVVWAGNEKRKKNINLPDDQHIGEVEDEGYKYRTLAFTVGPDCQHQDEMQDNIGLYQKSLRRCVDPS